LLKGSIVCFYKLGFPWMPLAKFIGCHASKL